ncbi:hypothetical protein BBZ83_00375 [Neisseria gonorrhoeae]|nr:hypothetical protein BBZ83_00375 [Neisseria gonorrhoeae]OIA97097.1 hypothetical protein BB034_10280 [Neisseria gonorrhoeae]
MKRYSAFRRHFLRLVQDAGACRLDFAEVVGSYSGLNLNQYSVASPCRTICTVCGFVALS